MLRFYVVIVSVLCSIFLFISSSSLATTTVVTNASSEPKYLSTYNGTITWHDDVDGDFEIFYWDGETIFQITDNSANDTLPSLYNGRITGVSDIDGDEEIYFWDGETTTQITDNETQDSSPSLYQKKQYCSSIQMTMTQPVSCFGKVR